MFVLMLPQLDMQPASFRGLLRIYFLLAEQKPTPCVLPEYGKKNSIMKFSKEYTATTGATALEYETADKETPAGSQ